MGEPVCVCGVCVEGRGGKGSLTFTAKVCLRASVCTCMCMRLRVHMRVCVGACQ